jgi:hypothetical protein
MPEADALPWLVPAPERESPGNSTRGAFLPIALALLIAVALAGALGFWARDSSPEEALDNALTGGTDVPQQNTTAVATRNATTKRPTMPAGIKKGSAAVEAKNASRRSERRPGGEADVTRSSSAAAAPTIQLGAFRTRKAAARALPKLRKAAGSLTAQIVEARRGDRTIFRVRASGAGAHRQCTKIRLAGFDCYIVR